MILKFLLLPPFYGVLHLRYSTELEEESEIGYPQVSSNYSVLYIVLYYLPVQDLRLLGG